MCACHRFFSPHVYDSMKMPRGMLKKSRLLTHPPQRAKTRRSASKAAADERTGGVTSGLH
jgi:hypothetical protein